MANQQQIETLVGEALQQAGATDNVILSAMTQLAGGLSTLFASDDALVNQNVRTWTKFNQVDDVVSNVVQKVSTALWSDSTSSLSTFYTSSAQSSSTSGKYYTDVYHKSVGAQGGKAKVTEEILHTLKIPILHCHEEKDLKKISDFVNHAKIIESPVALLCDFNLMRED